MSKLRLIHRATWRDCQIELTVRPNLHEQPLAPAYRTHTHQSDVCMQTKARQTRGPSVYAIVLG